MSCRFVITHFKTKWLYIFQFGPVSGGEREQKGEETRKIEEIGQEIQGQEHDQLPQFIAIIPKLAVPDKVLAFLGSIGFQ